MFAYIFCALFIVYTPSTLAAPHILGGAAPNTMKPGRLVAPRIAARRIAARLTSKITAASALPSAARALFLRVEFLPDTNPGTTGSGSWGDSDYAYDGDSDYWVNKNSAGIVDYYTQVSGGLFDLTVDISSAIYRLPNTLDYYGQETFASIENLIVDSVNAADADINAGIDFATYDALFIVHAGPGQETDIRDDSRDDIWSLYYFDEYISRDDQGTTTLTVDGVAITEAIFMPQTGAQDGIVVDPLGIYTHEFGHWLSLPDLYVTAAAQDWDGIGRWGLMGGGLYNRVSSAELFGSSPAQLCAWSKYFLGWTNTLEPNIDPDPGRQYLAPIDTGQAIVKLAINGAQSTEFLLLENRPKRGYDAGLPGGGLLVWHIDETVIERELPRNAVNNDRAHPGVALIEADGDNALKSAGSDVGSDGDPFPGSSGNHNLSPWTAPSTLSYTGSARVHLLDIAIQANDEISFEIGFSPTVPQGLTIERIINNTIRLNWSASAGPDLAHYNVFQNGVLARQLPEPSLILRALPDDRLVITATDSNGFESSYSPTISPDQAIEPDPRCFIATAAYGSPLAPQVEILREFRDRYLLRSTLGRHLVELYYDLSPPIARFIAQNEAGRFVTRLLILPFIAGAYVLLKTGLTSPILILTILLWRRYIMFFCSRMESGLPC